MAASEARSYLLAAEAAAEIVSQKLEILLSDPVCVGCLSIETRVKDSKAKLAIIQKFFSSKYRPVESMEWWRRLLQIMFYAEEFIDKLRLREARERKKALHVVGRPLAALVSKYMLWRDLSYLVNATEELCKDQHLTDKVTEGKELVSLPWQGTKFARLTSYWDRQRSANYLCREKEREEIMKRIGKSVDLGVQATSILGEEGAGKTFLARRVYGEASMYQSFEWRAWVHVSTCVDQREFLLEILKQVENLPMEGKDMDTPEINKMLCRKFITTKGFLIVLDDVRPSHEELSRGLVMIIPPRSQGHIITTTQDPRIATYMNTSVADPIGLNKLDDEESRRMLAMQLRGVADPRSLSKEEVNMLNMCRGLPLFISLLGGFLLNAGEYDRAALAKESSMMGLLDILQWSLYKLPVHLKLCFIYMALFPVAFPIPTRRLVKLWLAEGFLESRCWGRERKTTPEEVGETFILELADRNVIDVVSWRVDGSPKACQMLTSLYDMVCCTVMSTGFLHIHASSKSKDGNDRDPPGQQQQLLAQPPGKGRIRWLAEHTNIFTDDRNGSDPILNLVHVRSFLSFYLRRGILSKDISTLLKKMTSKTDYSLLRVLDLEGVYKPSLNDVLHKLVLLRYLGLRSTVLDSLPSAIADLHHLETLDIKHTNITSLPNSLWKAKKLRHLHLNWFYINLKTILEGRSNNDMALTKLQTLSGLVIGEVTENLMADHMTSLTTLKLFLHQLDRDSSGAAGKAVADWIKSGLPNLQSLTLGVTKKAKPAKETKPATSYIGPLPELLLVEKHHELFELYLLGQLNKPNWKQLLPVSLRVLTLSGSRVEEDMMPELGGLLRNLRTLRLFANSFLCKSMSFAKNGFPNLKILKIWKLPQLQEVIIDRGAMPCLNELEFRHLDMMTNLVGIDECRQLETIRVAIKRGAPGFVDSLKLRKREMTNLCNRQYIKRPASMDYDEDNSDDDNKATASP